ncbi:hypothetical protein SAMN05192564_102468 [Paraburkholderia sartisoli]|uniref:Uncharacterized protein n=1 Tax=Paraburkholderia sartisoli TaxID=83784 RepID=A0A1H4CT84_9BURK|nr:hypothetical protein SAMN05192564_102468 [Paraburkholderia sartisoli]
MMKSAQGACIGYAMEWFDAGEEAVNLSHENTSYRTARRNLN